MTPDVVNFMILIIQFLLHNSVKIFPLDPHHFFPATVAVHSRASPHRRRTQKCLQPELRARIESMPPRNPPPSTPAMDSVSLCRLYLTIFLNISTTRFNHKVTQYSPQVRRAFQWGCMQIVRVHSRQPHPSELVAVPVRHRTPDSTGSVNIYFFTISYSSIYSSFHVCHTLCVPM